METSDLRHNTNINIFLLSEKDREELLLFYEYLLFKSGKLMESKFIENKQTEKLPETFYSPIQVDRYQKFERDEIYANK